MPRQLEGFLEGPPEEMPSLEMLPPLTEEMKEYCEKHPKECGPLPEEKMPFFESSPSTEKEMPSFEEMKKLCAEDPKNEMCRKGFRPPMPPEGIEGVPPQGMPFQGMPSGMPSPEEQQQRAEYCKNHPEDPKCRAPEGETPWGQEYKPPEEFKPPEEGFKPPKEFRPPEEYRQMPFEGGMPLPEEMPPEGYRPLPPTTTEPPPSQTEAAPLPEGIP